MNYIDIPSRMLSSKSKKELEDGMGLITVTKTLNSSTEKDAVVDVLFADDKKVVAAYVRGAKSIDPSTNIIKDGGDAKSPYDECEDKPTNLGVLLCIANRISDAIFEK